MNELALFAGAGGGLLASNILGHNIVCAIERDDFCRSILIRRQNERLLQPFPIWDDVCTFNGKPWNGTVDLVSGGFPCQAFSSAARGRNIAEKNLWGEMYRIVREVCSEWVFAENVSEKAILLAKSDLEKEGYSCEYLQLSASELGGPHERQRFWLLAHSNNNGKLCSTINAETPLLQEFCRNPWEAKPPEFRVANGMARRMDRLKALGNGQVPIVAAIAFSRLMLRFIPKV